MAIVRRFAPVTLEPETTHSEAECTYSLVSDDQGRRYLQVDTYGSTDRQIPGRKAYRFGSRRKQSTS
jgi:hypothetical protein